MVRTLLQLHMIGLICGILLDQIIGDPYFMPHPIRDIGRLIMVLEEKFLGDRKIAYVAEAGGKIVALMFGVLDSNYEYFKNDYADLVGLYVRPEYQGMGVGTMLKDIFTHWAKENKADQFVIGVLKDNSKARKVYESWGGTLSEHEHEFKQMGVGYPEVFYTYEI